jgi:hypothetical protein
MYNETPRDYDMIANGQKANLILLLKIIFNYY